MAQDKIKINNIEIFQPDTGIQYSFASTYTEDSTRVQTGEGHFTPMFTVEQLGYTASHIPVSEATKILKQIAKGGNFTLHYYSLYAGKWQDALFYVGQGSLNIGSLVENNEYLDSLSFNMTGVNPID